MQHLLRQEQKKAKFEKCKQERSNDGFKHLLLISTKKLRSAVAKRSEEFVQYSQVCFERYVIHALWNKY